MSDFNYTQINQDQFALDVSGDKTNGYFIDIGAAHPVHINNTYMLESKRSWKGLSFDIGDENTEGCKHLKGDTHAYKRLWEEHRNTEIVIGDATKLDYKKIFQENNVPKVIDYLTMDLEPKEVTLEALNLIPFDEYQFKVITYETDEHRGNNCVGPSREILKKHGYTLFATVRFQDDFWVKEDLIDNVFYERAKRKCVGRFKQRCYQH